jgi:hypothetical protein
MKRALPYLLLILTLAAGVGAVYIVLRLLLRAIELVASFESEFAAALVATSGTILIGLVTLAFTNRYDKQKEIREAHRPQKVDIYKRFMETMVVDTLRRVKDKQDFSDKELVDKYQDFFLQFTADLIVWGSPGVIQAFRRFRSASTANQNGTVDQKETLLVLDDILREIRKDLGNSNWLLARGDLISTFLKNPEELKSILA